MMPPYQPPWLGYITDTRRPMLGSSTKAPVGEAPALAPPVSLIFGAVGVACHTPHETERCPFWQSAAPHVFGFAYSWRLSVP